MENYEPKAQIERQALLLQSKDRTIEVQDRTTEMLKDIIKSKDSVIENLRAKTDQLEAYNHAKTTGIDVLKADPNATKSNLGHVEESDAKADFHATRANSKVIQNILNPYKSLKRTNSAIHRLYPGMS